MSWQRNEAAAGMPLAVRNAPMSSALLRRPAAAADDRERALGRGQQLAHAREVAGRGRCGDARHGHARRRRRSWPRARPRAMRARPGRAGPRRPSRMRARRARGCAPAGRSRTPTWPCARTSARSRSPGTPRGRGARRGTWPISSTSGVESCIAVCTPVEACVAPGPARDHAHARAAGQLAVGVGGVGSSRLVAARDHAQPLAVRCRGRRAAPGSSRPARRTRARRRAARAGRRAPARRSSQRRPARPGRPCSAATSGARDPRRARSGWTASPGARAGSTMQRTNALGSSACVSA